MYRRNQQADVRCLGWQAVKDGTGREDLVAYLRRKLILDLAVQMGYNKVL